MKKIRLVKEDGIDGIWYVVYIDSYVPIAYAYKRDLEEAEKEYTRIKEILERGIVKETLREETVIENINQNLTNQNVETVQEEIH
jgi:hypothetical protein